MYFIIHSWTYVEKTLNYDSNVFMNQYWPHNKYQNVLFEKRITELKSFKFYRNAK